MQAKQKVMCDNTGLFFFFNIINNIIINMYVRGIADWRHSQITMDFFFFTFRQ